MVSLCFPIFFHPDCTVGFGVSPNHALRLVGCTTGRESHPALKILDSISGSIIAWYITECKPFLKPGQNRDGTTFRRRTLSRGLAPSSSLSFCQSFHRVFLQAAESDVFSKAACRMAGRTGSSCKQRRAGSSRWGTPCCTYRYRMWIFAGCVRVGAPCFCFALNLLTHGAQPHSTEENSRKKEKKRRRKCQNVIMVRLLPDRPRSAQRR